MFFRVVLPLMIVLVLGGWYLTQQSQQTNAPSPESLEGSANPVENLTVESTGTSTEGLSVEVSGSGDDKAPVSFRNALPTDAALKDPATGVEISDFPHLKPQPGFQVPDTMFLEPEKPSPPVYFNLAAGDANINAEYANTLRKQLRGLSGRESLGGDDGMFYSFQASDFYTFWMRDMKFPIDIIWIGSDNRVVDITKHISPNSFPKTFTSQVKAQYVVEVNAGYADKHGIAVGTTVDLSGAPR
ncbi:DUF192 domain-containing protein [Candidatus Uhrbacteria bacterium]|nr:DUF192 domain-containing protein [Candidatus Uhrbacteria bacterium]